MKLKEWLEDMKDRFRYWVDQISCLFDIEISIELFEILIRFNILSFDIIINFKLPKSFDFNFNEICSIYKRLTKEWVFDFNIVFYNTLKTGISFNKEIHKHDNYRMCFDIYILGLVFASQIYYDLQNIEKEKNIYSVMFNKRFLRAGKKSKNKAERRKKKEINKILMEWNPIGVPPQAKYTEYVFYIDDIYSIGDNEIELTNHLKNIITNSLRMEYSSLQEKNTKKAVYKIILLYE